MRKCQPSCTCGKHVCLPETKAKISASLKGHETSEETKAKISASQQGNTNRLGHETSPEAKANLSAALLGHETSQEHKAKISAAQSLPILPGHDAHHQNEIVSEDTFENLQEKEHGQHGRDHAAEREARRRG